MELTVNITTITANIITIFGILMHYINILRNLNILILI